jgi:hypothetical protein
VLSETAEGDARTLDVHVASTRGAHAILVAAKGLVASEEESGVLSVAWNGHVLERPKPAGGRTWVFLGAGAEGVDLRLRAPRDARAELRVVDVVSGLPSSSAELVRARPATCAPRSSGDVSLLVRRVEL